MAFQALLCLRENQAHVPVKWLVKITSWTGDILNKGATLLGCFLISQLRIVYLFIFIDAYF